MYDETCAKCQEALDQDNNCPNGCTEDPDYVIADALRRDDPSDDRRQSDSQIFSR